MQNQRTLRFSISMLMIATCVFYNVSAAQDLSGPEVARNAHQAFYRAGEDVRSRVVMKLISKNGKERTRELTMLRLNEGDEGAQKYYMYFHRPNDVRAMTFMVWKYAGRDDDRWLYIPAIKLVKRIAAEDKNAGFVGSDFSYEDVSGRDLKDDIHSISQEDTIHGKTVFVLESVPKKANSTYYSRKVAWIDKQTFLPLKEEYYDARGGLLKRFTAEEIEDFEGVPTITKQTMINVQSGHRTEVTLTDVAYNIGLKDDLFSERYLRNAPRRWVR